MEEVEVETIITINNPTTTNNHLIPEAEVEEEEVTISSSSRTTNSKININRSREITSTTNNRTIIVAVVEVEFRVGGPKEQRLTKIIILLNRKVEMVAIATIADIQVRTEISVIIVTKTVEV